MKKEEKVVQPPHPPYFSLLGPCDFVLVPRLKMLAGRRYNNRTALESDIFLWSISVDEYKEAFRNWIRRQQKGRAQGDYFGKMK